MLRVMGGGVWGMGGLEWLEGVDAEKLGFGGLEVLSSFGSVSVLYNKLWLETQTRLYDG